jgi:hypothetical protein
MIRINIFLSSVYLYNKIISNKTIDMSGLKPIGSEKLEGMDKIRRIMEIARYNEVLPQPVNENESKEYSLGLADGNNYEIVRERQGYIIKMSINESETDYIEPMKNRKYFSSYSQALKKLNLMAKEFNTLYENAEGTSLFNEQKKKYKLKLKKPKADLEPAAEPAPVEAPIPAPAPELPPAPEIPAAPDMGMGGEELPPAPDMGMGGEEPMGEEPMGEEPPMEDEEVDVEEEGGEKGPVEFKRIQILVGKLAQKIRQYEEDKDLSAKDVKYIINSILSSLDVDVLDEEDIEQIIAKLEGDDEDEEGEDGTSEEEMDVDMEEEMPEEPELAEMDFDSLAAAQGEVTEYDSYGKAFNDYLGGAYGNEMLRKMSDEISEDDDMDLNGFKPVTDVDMDLNGFEGEDDDIEQILQKLRPYNSTSDNDMSIPEIDESDDENYKLRKRGARFIKPNNKTFTHGTFNESKIDKVLEKYFVLTESEQQKERDNRREKHEELYRINQKNVISLSESTEQLKSALWYIKHNSESRLMGVSNKGNMIFKEGLNDIKITKTGEIL